MSDDPFYSSKYSVERAKHHVNDLKLQIAEFFKTTPYTRVCETNADRTQNIHKFKLIKPMPVHLSGIARDAVFSLRSALDQAMYAMTGKFLYFPFRNSKSEFKDAMKDVRKSVPKEIANLVSGFKPYKGGDDLLWALNKMNNPNKHGIIRPVAFALLVAQFERDDGVPAPRIPAWDRTKNEMEFILSVPSAPVEPKFEIATWVAICDVEVVDGQPVDAVLNNLTSKVEGIVMALEAEAKRIGLV